MKKDDKKQEVVKKNPTRQKIIVEQGRAMMGEQIEYKVLYTEIAPDAATAKQREKELKEEYKDTEAVSIHYFSL